MFPGPLLAGASGLLFGTALGTPTAIVAATLGACAAFCARALRRAARSTSCRAARRACRNGSAQRGFLAVLYARILPAMPYNLVNYAAGLTRVRLAVFAARDRDRLRAARVRLGGARRQPRDLGSPAALAAFGVLIAMGVGGARASRRATCAGRSGDRRRRGRRSCLDLEQARRPRTAARQTGRDADAVAAA